MLISLFTWLDGHPNAYWAGSLAATAALLAWMGFEWRAAARGKTWRFAGAGFAALLFLFLLAWRWPFLFCAHEYNPDESQFIAGALTLAHDPVFWRSVDGTTSGPLNFYALLPLHWLGLPLDYFTVRLAGLLLCWAALLGVARALQSTVAPFAARLAVFGGAVFLAVVIEPDFVHYSSELAPLALLGLSLAWVERRPRAAAFVAGLLPWAKLQAAPLAAVIVGWQLVVTWQRQGPRRWRDGAVLVGWAAVPSVVALGLVTAFGQLDYFYRRYVTQNVVYVGSPSQPRARILSELWRNASDTHLFPIWFWCCLLVLLAAGMLAAARRWRPPALYWLGAALSAMTVFCVLLPARTSLHYVLFFTVPLALWLGAALGGLRLPSVGRSLVLGLAWLGALTPLAWRLTGPVPGMFGEFSTHWRQPYSQLGSVLHYWRNAGARLTVWGWMNSAYAESGLPQGVRDMLTVWSILPSPQRDYYRGAYLADLQRNRPEIFVDSVGPGAPFINNRQVEGHETFPALAAYIRQNYRLVVDVQPSRVYVRHDFLTAHPLPILELQRLVARGNLQFDEPSAPDRLSPANAPRSRAGGRDVQMLEPPAEMTWRLTGTERKLRFDFGFHPRAYTEGKTDGAEFIVELRMPGQPPLQVFERPLDPQHQPGDRGPLSGEVDLPPFPAGTTLAVRTTAGRNGDSAWDWVYFGQMRIAHSPFYSPRQFPGFRRIPDHADAVYPYLIGQYPDQLLMLAPPAALTFVLEGSERQMNFTYGFQEGAYTGEGRTDGAIYRVELQHADGTTRGLFEHRLNPVQDPNNRGPQHADLVLPPDVRAGDRLVLSIDPGAGNSWDWTYISALDLR